MKFKYFGHACFGVEVAGKNILFDPYISPNELAKDIELDSIKADYILLSHGHSDHIADCVSIAKKNNAKVIGAYEVTEWIAKQGVEKDAQKLYVNRGFGFIGYPGRVGILPEITVVELT